jgi:hypothetical protein
MPKRPFFLLILFPLFLNFFVVSAEQENIITLIPEELKSFTKVEANVDCPTGDKFCQITLNCLDSGSCSKAKIYFCVDQENKCYPRILYTVPFKVGKEGKKYIRYYSLAETPPETETPTPQEEEKPPEPEIVRKSFFQRIFEAIKRIFEAIKAFFKRLFSEKF